MILLPTFAIQFALQMYKCLILAFSFNAQIHPNDRRKIERSLQVFNDTKIPQSHIFCDQRQRGGVLGGPLRFKYAIIFWIQCQQEGKSIGGEQKAQFKSSSLSQTEIISRVILNLQLIPPCLFGNDRSSKLLRTVLVIHLNLF